MDPQQALLVLDNFRQRASGPHLSGKDYDDAKTAIMVLAKFVHENSEGKKDSNGKT